MMRAFPQSALRLLLLAACSSACSIGSAQTVWSGLTKSFSKGSFTDHTLPENQDALTANVRLTRAFSGGLFNIAAESAYSAQDSPALTLWATDLNNPEQIIAAANWRNLEFTNWINAYGGQQTQGSFIAHRDAVVYLTSDDVFLDLRFTSWGPGVGGGYTYLRAEPPGGGPLPTGDYNGNGTVDAADYVLWRKTLGLAVSPNGSGADGNANGTIDAGDYDFWRERFGNPVPASSPGLLSVPEPNSCAWILTLFFASALRTSRRATPTRHRAA